MRKNMKSRLAIFLVVLFGCRCETNAQPPAKPFVTVKGRRFIDPQGRQILLHGLSIIDKNKAHGYMSWHGPEQFAAMCGWGMNCIRLGVLWDGLEPKPGQYDQAYLAQLDKPADDDEAAA